MGPRLRFGCDVLGAAALVSACAGNAGTAAVTAPPCGPLAAPSYWMDWSASPDERAARWVQAMTDVEKLAVITGYFGVQSDWNEFRFPEARPQSAGFVRGVPRLALTPQWQCDAGLGVATQGEAPPALERTLLPSGLLTTSSWDPSVAERGGAMIGAEARASGFNVMLAGGVNLMREPGNGRNFEYGGEDPLLAGTLVGALVRGIQSNHIVATVKHFALNDQESGRLSVNVVIEEAAARESDLLAFELAIEAGDPGAVMCSYNLVNGVHACQNEWLLERVLKGDWGFRGYVMTDWGAQHDARSDANHGLDQITGISRSEAHAWVDELSAAVRRGEVSTARFDDMVLRVVRTLIAKGAVDEPVALAPIDFEAHAQVAQASAEAGIVLLKNDGTLPLGAGIKDIVVIGGHADRGVLTGGGSAQVYAPGGNAVRGLSPEHWPGPPVYAPSSPLAALAGELPAASVRWVDGADPAAAASAAAKADVALVFVTQWTAESRDFPLTLPDKQDELVEAVARANRRTVVILETGGPVLMPWLERVAGALEAWYPGSRGGPAIARVLSGAVNPSGHLPVSFPRSLAELPRSSIMGVGATPDLVFDVRYDEGSAVGYRWYEIKAQSPLLAFGHGLSYTTFAHEKLTAKVDGDAVRVAFRVQNTGTRSGQDVPQIYVSPPGRASQTPKRLAGFTKLDLLPGASRDVTITLEPRRLAHWDPARGAFVVGQGEYRVTLASSAGDRGESVSLALEERTLRPLRKSP